MKEHSRPSNGISSRNKPIHHVAMRHREPGAHPKTWEIVGLSIAFATRSARALLIASTTLLLVALLLHSSDAHGATASGKSKIRSVLTHDSSLGSCMAYVGGIPLNLNCRHNGSGIGWITFDCAGKYKPASRGRDAFKLATLAMITNRPIKYKLDDTEKHGGYCHAYQTIFDY